MQDKSTNQVQLKVYVAASAKKVYELLNTPEGRCAFWADEAPEVDGVIHFYFSNGMRHQGRILERIPGEKFVVEYFGGSKAAFNLNVEKDGGTVVKITETSIPQEWLAEQRAGWVTVLLMLKAAVDHGIDLRNPDPERNWENGYVDV